MTTTNLAAYKFATLTDLKVLRARLIAQCKSWNLKGTILLSAEGINPARRTSPKLAAATLKQWLDEGRPLTLLDTRNDYEVKLGTFKGALPIGVDNFRQFPDAVTRVGSHY